MRNKIKQLMNKEEGFTLVELLAVIVILGIILAIAVPQIGNVINRAKTSANEAEQELVIDATRLYLIENPKELASFDITVKDLVDDGYLENNFSTDASGNIINSDDNYLKTTDKVTVTKNDGNYTYEFIKAS